MDYAKCDLVLSCLDKWLASVLFVLQAITINTVQVQYEVMAMNRNVLVDNEWVRFLEDKFALPNGTDCTYYHAQKSDAIMAIAVDTEENENSTYIVNQHRHPIDKTLWQFPIGGFDASKSSPEDAARKELQEETGVVAGSMDYLGWFYADPGFTNQKLHVCATRDIIRRGEQQLEQLEHGLVCKKVSVGQISLMIDSGDLGDAWGLAAYYYLNKYLLLAA